jgi:hypothetical protein
MWEDVGKLPSVMDDPDFNELRNIILPDADKQPDRSMVIVLVSVVDDHLFTAIKAKLVENKKVEERIFTGLGPLATFSSRIDMGLLLGLYRDDFAKVLHGLRKVRNAFAHEMRPLTLESPEIRGMANVFKFVNERRRHQKDTTAREEFQITCAYTLGALAALANIAERLTPPSTSRL